METVLSNIVLPIIVGVILTLLSYWLDKRKKNGDK
ncbi:type I toxin-antitoxin system Fst family toxin [Mammaliicoccus vitulinus]|nr:type I toxin-antitoxin system Fst family toxin [Mammaliicoccus vitulinus]MBM6629206.1 type I toxin-antitoxin system Fst family toxin [Mammaliicoccus vitulinus]